MEHYLKILEAAKAAGACSGPVADLEAAIAANDLAAADKVVSDNFGWCIGTILHALESGRSYAASKIEYSLDENGERHGEFKWYANGSLYEHVQYLHGKIHGEWKVYYSDGTLSEHVRYENGKLLEKIIW